MSICNGYNMIYMPQHHRANKDGFVYEHIVVAEEKLGRLLYDEEVVHHINHIRNDNSPDNLMVFATGSDHTIFHSSGKCELVGDHYIGIRRKNYCKVCGKETTHLTDTYCSHECFNIDNRRVERPSKEELEKLIHTYPFTQIGKMYGLSDNAIRKWCKSYNLPYKRKDLNK